MKNKKKHTSEIADSKETAFNYNKYIKRKLIEWRNSFEAVNCATLNYSAIAKKMEDDYKIKTSAQKISAMFDELSEREVKLKELAALAQMFNIPLYNICEYPNVPSSDMELTTLIKANISKAKPIQHLNNKFYEGHYYCYYFRPKHYYDCINPVEETKIEEAELKISIENSRTIITLKEMKSNTTFYGEPMPAFTLKGNLYHFENTDMAYSLIKDETGSRAMAIMFTYLNIKTDIRYYIPAATMTFSLNQTQSPLFQKMAIFRVRQNYKNDETADVLRGILALNTGPIIIDEEILNKLINQDEIFKEILSPDKALKKCYLFSETTIRSDLFFMSNEDEKSKKILQIKRNSLLSAHEIVSEPEYFADFIKEYQLKKLYNIEKDSDK